MKTDPGKLLRVFGVREWSTGATVLRASLSLVCLNLAGASLLPACVGGGRQHPEEVDVDLRGFPIAAICGVGGGRGEFVEVDGIRFPGDSVAVECDAKSDALRLKLHAGDEFWGVDVYLELLEASEGYYCLATVSEYSDVEGVSPLEVLDGSGVVHLGDSGLGLGPVDSVRFTVTLVHLERGRARLRVYRGFADVPEGAEVIGGVRRSADGVNGYSESGVLAEDVDSPGFQLGLSGYRFQREGKYQIYSDESRMVAECEFRAGEPDGAWRAYSESGEILELGYLSLGQRVGPWIEMWWGDSIRTRTVHYREGRQNGPAYCVDSIAGQVEALTYREGLLEGDYLQWWPNGEVRIEGMYYRGLRVGPWREFTEQGELQRVTPYISPPTR